MIYQNIITPQQLKEKIDKKEEVFIVDIREHTSFYSPIDSAIHISVTKIMDNLNSLPKDKIVVLYCAHGVDSFFLMNLLKTEHGFSKVFSLKSGIEGWCKFLGKESKV